MVDSETTKLRDMLGLVLHIADAMVAVCEHEGMEVDGMTLVMQHNDTGERKEVETSPRKVIDWVKAELGMVPTRIEITTDEVGHD